MGAFDSSDVYRDGTRASDDSERPITVAPNTHPPKQTSALSR